MNIKSKGFTIVELAIVLVVIGLILGMAIKGNALVKAARYRMEVAKIRNMEVYLFAYHAATDGDLKFVSGDDNPLCDTFIAVDPMVEGGIFTRQDMTSSYFYGWQESNPAVRANLSYIYTLNAVGPNDLGPLLCLPLEEAKFVWIYPSHDPNIGGGPDRRTRVEWEYACYMEKMIEERVKFSDGAGGVADPGQSGRVRILHHSGNTGIDYTYEDYDDCLTPPAGLTNGIPRPIIYVGEIF